jgi:hypothetical protein
MLYIFILFLIFTQPVKAIDQTEVESLFEKEKTLPADGIAPAVRVVEQLIKELKNEINVERAGKRVATLRRLIGEGAGVGGLRSKKTHPGNYKANGSETAALINAIAYIETAATLVDANFSYHFCSREQIRPGGSKINILGAYRSESAEILNKMAVEGTLNFEQQAHLTTVYALARATQLRIAKHNIMSGELPIYIRKTINSRNLPNFMKDIYKSNLINSDNFETTLKDQLNPWDLIDFKNPQLKLISIQRDIKEKIKKDQIYPAFSGTPAINGCGNMQRFDVIDNGACFWYTNNSIYGDEEPWDVIDLVIDNLRDQEDLREKLKSGIQNGFVFTGTSSDFTVLQEQALNSLKRPDLSLDKQIEELKKVLEFCKKLIQEKMDNVREMQYFSSLSDLLHPKREIIIWEPVYDFTASDVKIDKLETRETLDQSQLIYSKNHYHNRGHVDILVPEKTQTPQILVDWIKARETEKKTIA